MPRPKVPAWQPSARCCRSPASAFWRLRRGAAGGARQGLMLWRSSLRCDSTAMLALGSRRTTHFARFALCVQTGAASQSTKRASHADRGPGLAGRAGPGGPAVRKAQAVRWTACVRAHLLVATEIAPTGHRPPRCNARGSCREQRPRPSRGAFGQDGAAPLGRREGEPGGKRCGGPLAPCERPGRLARRGLQGQGSWPRAKRESLTDSSRMSERSERSERSEFCDGATRPSIAGTSARSADRSSEAPRPARTRLCRASRVLHSGR